MYEAHWNLRQRPFEATADPQFYYPGESHQGAVLKLRYAIEHRRGAAALAGPAGCGKTLVVRLLRRQLNESACPLAHLVFPDLPPRELLAYLAAELGAATASPRDLDQTVLVIQRLLTDNAAQGRHALVIVDEAHLIDNPRAFEILRLLLNFESDGAATLTLLLVGQTALLPMLDRMPELDQRMAVKCLLRALTLEETISYVHHRLQAAGAVREIFTAEALETLHALTGGAPRRINRLCDLALLIGYAEGRTTIGPDQLESVCQELVAITPE
jgi:type II secretory pathway predicted ATPase ExeA